MLLCYSPSYFSIKILLVNIHYTILHTYVLGHIQYMLHNWWPTSAKMGVTINLCSHLLITIIIGYSLDHACMMQMVIMANIGRVNVYRSANDQNQCL